MSEPEDLVLMLLREMRAELGDVRRSMATKGDVAEVKADVADVRSALSSLRADVASDLMTLEKRIGDRIAHLNRAAWSGI